LIFFIIGAATAWGSEYLQRTRMRAAASAGRAAHPQSILDTVPDAMVVIDERGIIRSFSLAAERLFGYTTADALGKNIKLLMPRPLLRGANGHQPMVSRLPRQSTQPPASVSKLSPLVLVGKILSG
jgi:two-component system sensor kinase FixL